MSSEAEVPRPRLARVKGWVRRAAPWFSLATGLAGAIVMDRSPERAGVVAAAATLGWLGVLTSAVVARRVREAPRTRWQGVLSFGSRTSSQTMVQTTLFFVLPFFWRAAMLEPEHLEPGHLVWLVALGLAAAVTLWDPAFAAVLGRPAPAVALTGLASFSGVLVAGPMLGLSTALSLWVAAGLTSICAPLVVSLAVPPGERRRALTLGAIVAAGLDAALVGGGARVVPAAPLRLVHAAIGTEIVDKDLVDPRARISHRPERLVCATAIGAPLGLRDALFHVWRQDGELRDRIALEVTGGRRRGFRTWSIKEHLGHDPTGIWTCAVETETGQKLGGAQVRIGKARP